MPNHKTIYLPSNFNNKLACDAMIHIDLAPRDRVMESTLENTVIEIRTQDNSYPASNWKLLSLRRLPLHKVTDDITLQSHAMESFEFAKWLLERNKTGDSNLPIAVYYYQRIKA